MKALGAADQAPDVLHANPAERQRSISKEVDAKVSNNEVRGWYTGLANVSGTEADASIAEHAKRAGLTACLGYSLADLVVEARHVEVPEIADPGLPPLPSGALTVIATADAIVIGGMPVQLASIAVRIAKAPAVVLAVQRAVPMSRAMEVASAVAHAGITTLSFAVRTPAGYRVAPITVPHKRPADPRHPGADLGIAPVAPAIAVSETRVILWSISGREGTLQDPKLTVTSSKLDELTKAVTELAKANPDEHAILVVSNPTVSVQRAVEVIGAVREAFPEVTLGQGLE
jgi:biopolymer transport protein ExbD